MTVVTTTSATELAYETFGSRSDPPLLLIQGFGAQMIGWRPELCRALADAGFWTIRFDNRDVGKSQKFPGTKYELVDMAADVAGLLEGLRIPAAHIVGQSMGGMIAQELAISNPDSVRSLALIYTAASTAWIRADAVDRPTPVRPSSRKTAIEDYLAGEALCASPGYPQDITWLTKLGGSMYERDPDQEGVARQRVALLNSRDRSGLLSQIQTPTLIITGDGDRLIDPAASEDLRNRIEGASLRVVPGMGHELPLALLDTIVADIVRNAARGEENARSSTENGLLRVRVPGNPETS